MSDSDSYLQWQLANLSASLAKGHEDQANLRQLLICTTSKTTAEAAEAYFLAHHGDGDLLQSLINIALEGDDAGDAPWAAANVLSEFSASMLQRHEAALTKLAAHPWMYLHVPARKALEKVRAHDA